MMPFIVKNAMFSFERSSSLHKRMFVCEQSLPQRRFQIAAQIPPSPVNTDKTRNTRVMRCNVLAMSNDLLIPKRAGIEWSPFARSKLISAMAYNTSKPDTQNNAAIPSNTNSTGIVPVIAIATAGGTMT